jgi:hypothetical protein
MTQKGLPAEHFRSVFAAELKEIGDRRQATDRQPVTRSGPTTELGLTGIALSGGGVRSATFCLGVVQSIIARCGLQRLDYLSTVSGGGYLGSLISNWFSQTRLGQPDGISPSRMAEMVEIDKAGSKVRC